MPPKTRDLVPADATDEMCAYEAERARRIASNRRRMAELGLATMASAAGLGAETRPGGGGGALPDGDARGPRLRRGRALEKLKRGAAGAPARASRRLRGVAADGDEGADDVDAVARAPPKRPRYDESDAGEGEIKRRGLPFPDPADDPSSAIVAPFSLASIGVTVLELGSGALNIQSLSFSPDPSVGFNI
jgi:hypothetical protein